MTLRVLTAADIPGGMRLKETAGWNQTELDWRNVMALAPEGCFGIESDGDLRATATAVAFGQELGWIGMVLTDPAYRGRGFARCLMEHAIGHLQQRGVRRIKLDATDMGRPLYERLGFRAEGGIERWAWQGGGTPSQQVGPLVMDAALDRAAFGADRSALLEVLARIESASVPGAGFAMGRPGSNGAFFGPCVARSADAARRLAGWFLERHSGERVYWDILPANRDAAALARECGFERARELIRMALVGTGLPPLGNDDGLVFGAAGFEYG